MWTDWKEHFAFAEKLLVVAKAESRAEIKCNLSSSGIYERISVSLKSWASVQQMTELLTTILVHVQVLKGNYALLNGTVKYDKGF